jgi:RNA polymerase sigma-70 factor (ECF subfamily)
VLFRDFAPRLFPVCLRYSDSREEAEDLLQEGFITIFTKINQFKGEGSFEGWMKKIVINHAMMRFRERKSSRGMVPMDPWLEARIREEDDDLPEELRDEVRDVISATQFTEVELLEIIQTLPEGYKLIFNLVVLEEMRHKDAARLLGISESTSKSQLLRARKLIRKKLYEAATSTERRKRHENLFLLMMMDMKDDFGYIDNLMREGIGEIRLSPDTNWSSMEGRLREMGSTPAGTTDPFLSQTIQHSNPLITKIQFVISKMVQNLQTLTILTASSLISLTTLTQSTGPTMVGSYFEIPLESVSPEVFSETGQSILPAGQSSSVDNQPNPESTEVIFTDTVKVPVKKIIYRKKQVIKVDTVYIRKEITTQD